MYMIQDPQIYIYNTYCTYIHYVIILSTKHMYDFLAINTGNRFNKWPSASF